MVIDDALICEHATDDISDQGLARRLKACIEDGLMLWI